MAKNKEEEANFDSIAAAMASGNTAELDRLMASENTESEEVEETEEVAPPEAEIDPDQSSEDQGEESETEEVEDASSVIEAADTNAASPAPVEVEDLKKELHKYKSDAGRVPFMQRRLVELERELLAVKARTAVSATSNPADLSTVELDKETQDQIEELRSIDPILAKTLERVAKSAVASAASKVDNAVNTFTQHDQEIEDSRFFDEQKSALVQAVPQADAIFASPEWREWKQSLSPGRRAMAESAYAEEVTQAIYAFAGDMQQRYGNANAQQVTPPAQEADAVTQARQRKVNTSAEVRTPSAKAAAPFDEDKLFAEMYKTIGKENHLY